MRTGCAGGCAGVVRRGCAEGLCGGCAGCAGCAVVVRGLCGGCAQQLLDKQLFLYIIVEIQSLKVKEVL